MTIGQRAAAMIAEKSKGKKVGEELAHLHVFRQQYYQWRNGESNPSASCVAQMALAGYDIYWILTGEKSYPIHEVDFDIAEYEEEE